MSCNLRKAGRKGTKGQGDKGASKSARIFVFIFGVPFILFFSFYFYVAISQAENAVKFQPKWLWTEDKFPGEDNIEDLVFELANKERVKNKLPLYKNDASLVIAARQHSKEMIDMDYFAHGSPKKDWVEPYHRAYYAGFFEAFVGENIAYNFGENDKMAAKNLMQTWMKSPGHRANILNKEYTHLGVGIVKTRKNFEGYDYDYYYATQVFAQKYYDYGEISVAEDEYFYILSGTATLLGKLTSVRIVRDDGDVDEKTANAGGAFSFSVKVKKKSGKHKIGLFPGNTVKYQFFLDTDKPVSDVFIPRFYEY